MARLWTNITDSVVLLENPSKTREAKLSMCQALLSRAAATDNNNTLEHLEDCLFVMISRNRSIESCDILLETGLDPSFFRNNCSPMHVAISNGNEPVCRLLVQHGVDPFLPASHEETTSFLFAARKQDISIFEYFMGLWDERFPLIVKKMIVASTRLK
jgi:ankyrin repeat protein